jgi:hypothetical protein
VPYITQAQLSDALGPVTFLAIFDDNNDGALDSTAVALVLLRAHARVTSQLLSELDTLPPEEPAAVDPILVSAELDYAVAFSFERHPEYVRTAGGTGKSPQEARADATMKAILAASAQLQQGPTQGAPRNSGGAFIDTSHRVALDNVDGSRNSGDF